MSPFTRVLPKSRMQVFFIAFAGLRPRQRLNQVDDVLFHVGERWFEAVGFGLWSK